MTDCKYWNESWGPSFAGRCSAPDDVSTNAANKICLSPQTCPYLLEPLYKKKSQMNNQEILNSLNEKIKAAEEALLYLNQTKAGLERVIANSTKTPVEEAYKKVYGVYPIDSIDKTWDPFQAGYNAAYKEPEENEWKNVALKFGEKLGSIGPCGYYEFSPDDWFEWAVNTYEKLADDWLILLNKEKQLRRLTEKLQEKELTYKVTDEKGETNPYKQYMNSVKNLEENNWYLDAKSLVNPPTLYNVIADWWDEIFVNGNPSGQNIESLVEQIEKWLPKPIKETCGLNEYDEAYYNGWNMYRENLIKKLV